MAGHASNHLKTIEMESVCRIFVQFTMVGLTCTALPELFFDTLYYRGSRFKLQNVHVAIFLNLGPAMWGNRSGLTWLLYEIDYIFRLMIN